MPRQERTERTKRKGKWTSFLDARRNKKYWECSPCRKLWQYVANSTSVAMCNTAREISTSQKVSMNHSCCESILGVLTCCISVVPAILGHLHPYLTITSREIGHKFSITKIFWQEAEFLRMTISPFVWSSHQFLSVFHVHFISSSFSGLWALYWLASLLLYNLFSCVNHKIDTLWGPKGVTRPHTLSSVDVLNSCTQGKNQ